VTATLEQANAALRTAVQTRLDATPADDPKMRGYVSPAVTKPVPEVAKAEESEQVNDPTPLQTQAFLERLRGDFLLQSDVHPTSQAFFNLCDQLKALHASKSQDYGCPSGTDPLANIRNGAAFVGIPSWKGAMVRLSDKVTRLATFNATGRLHHEGVEDNLFDLASYALLALLLYRESRDT
jgi:hypothetical protein